MSEGLQKKSTHISTSLYFNRKTETAWFFFLTCKRPANLTTPHPRRLLSGSTRLIWYTSTARNLWAWPPSLLTTIQAIRSLLSEKHHKHNSLFFICIFGLFLILKTFADIPLVFWKWCCQKEHINNKYIIKHILQRRYNHQLHLARHRKSVE